MASVFFDQLHFLWWGLNTTPAFISCWGSQTSGSLDHLVNQLARTSLLNVTYADFYRELKKKKKTQPQPIVNGSKSQHTQLSAVSPGKPGKSLLPHDGSSDYNISPRKKECSLSPPWFWLSFWYLRDEKWERMDRKYNFHLFKLMMSWDGIKS